jgi:hypothetical protein
MADAVEDGDVGLAAALEWHLTGNMYPPLPTFYVEPLIEAIENVNAGDGQVIVSFEVPTGGRYLIPRTARYDEVGEHYEMTSWELVSVMRAESFLSEQDEEW